MARKSVIARNDKRILMVNANFEKRQELREKSKKGDVEAQRALARMKRNTSSIRIKNRDAIDGRPQAYMRRFGLSRINFRKKAHKGEIPGVRKASW